MKKKLYMLGLILALAFTAVGCGKKKGSDDSATATDSAEIKADLLEFVNTELPAIEADREKAVGIYNAYFTSEDIDLEQYLNDLQTVAIPAMETYVTNLTAIEVSSDDVDNLKSLYLQYANKQLEAMKLVTKAISEQNADYLDQADECITESKALIAQYNDELLKLAKANEIDVEGATPTDATSTDAE